MRARSIRISVGIVLILGVALAALGFKTIDIPVLGERDGSGPLGLKLGLDLRGGGHLVYQADTGTRFDLTFAEPVDFNELSTALNDLRFGADDLALDGLQIIPRDLRLTQPEEMSADEDAESPAVPSGEEGHTAGSADNDGGADIETTEAAVVAVTPVVTRVQVRTSLFNDDDPRRTQLRSTLTDQFGEVSLFQINDIGEPTRDQMEGVLDNITRRVNRFGTEEPIIQIFGDDRIIVQLPGASGSVSEIRFVEPVTESEDLAALPLLLESAGFEDFVIDGSSDQRTFRVTSDTIGRAAQNAALNSLTDQIGSIESFEVTSGIDEA